MASVLALCCPSFQASLEPALPSLGTISAPQIPGLAFLPASRLVPFLHFAPIILSTLSLFRELSQLHFAHKAFFFFKKSRPISCDFGEGVFYAQLSEVGWQARGQGSQSQYPRPLGTEIG